MSIVYLVLFFFFFQAEDGIRDRTVTGVQTCALPICFHKRGAPCARPACNASASASIRSTPPISKRSPDATVCARSEERRVGKECRSRWSPSHEKKKGRERLCAASSISRQRR